jgi:ABC-type glycerol-3-phosphate transport system permease component
MIRSGSRRAGWRAQDVDRLLPRWVSRAVIAVLLIAIAVPLLYMLVLSVTPDAQVALGNFSLGHFAFGNYLSMWSQAPLAAGLIHTLIIAGLAALASVILGFLAAYPLARTEFRGRAAFLNALIGAQTVPGTTLLLPLFVVFSWIQTALGITLIGGYFAPIVTYMTFGLPLSTWLLLSYMRSVPRALEEAAFIDGCTPVGALFRVIFPVALPAAVVAFVFSFLVGWNDVLFASVLTRSNTQTLAIVVDQLANNQSNGGLPLYGELMAAGVVSSIPVVVLYLLLQRHLIQGLGAGSVTGV